MLSLVVAVGFAMIFYGLAAYERMTAWAWAVASFGLSFVVMQLWPGFMAMILAQVGLFGLMWWYNARRADTREQQWAAKREQERRAQEERMRRAQEEIERDRQRREK